MSYVGPTEHLPQQWASLACDSGGSGPLTPSLSDRPYPDTQVGLSGTEFQVKG